LDEKRSFFCDEGFQTIIMLRLARNSHVQAPRLMFKSSQVVIARRAVSSSSSSSASGLATLGMGIGLGAGSVWLLGQSKQSSSSPSLFSAVLPGSDRIACCSTTTGLCEVVNCAEEEEFSLAQKCAAEAIGTGIIVGGGCGAVCSLKYAGGTPIQSVALAFGASVALVRHLLITW
jgi:glycerol uptake facilitator-like aquaporin